MSEQVQSHQVTVPKIKSAIKRNLNPTADNIIKDEQYYRDRDKQPIKGIFHNYEQPGTPIAFPFRKYKGDEIENYEFMDGEIYEVPYMIAKHLNTSGEYWMFEHHPMDSTIKASANNYERGGMRLAKKKKRYGFQTLEFMDVEDVGTSDKLVTVEYTPQDF